MDIVITDIRVTASQQMVFKLLRAGIKEIQSPVFGSNPNVSVGIFAELADYISRKRIFRTIGIIPLNILMLGRQVTHPTEIRPDPDSPFPVLITGIDTFFILSVVGRQTFSCRGVECIKSVVGAEDDEVDARFIQVKAELIDAIAKNPSNGELDLDLLMIAKYFERIADHAVNIAEWVIFAVTGVHKGDKGL